MNFLKMILWLVGLTVQSTLLFIVITEAKEDSVLFPIGTHNDDLGTQMLGGKDDGFEQLDLTEPIWFYGQSHNSIFVDINGYISFGSGSTFFNTFDFPSAFLKMLIAPLYIDADTTRHGQVFYRESVHTEVLARCNAYITDAFGDSTDVKSVVIATWYEVVQWQGDASSKKNTFQLVICVDGTTSYILFNYDNIEWISPPPSPWSTTTYAQAGFNAGDGNSFYSLPGSALSTFADTVNKKKRVALKVEGDMTITTAVISCGLPPALPNGNVEPESLLNPQDTQVTYSCNEGYNISGESAAHCSFDAKWSGARNCNIIDCDDEHVIENGDVDTGSGTTYGKVATYNCNENFELIGEKTRTCETGGWGGAAPRCENICYLPLAKGDPECIAVGKENRNYFYFNQESGTCENMSYTGCGGNGNKFEFKNECKEVCIGTAQKKPKKKL